MNTTGAGARSQEDIAKAQREAEETGDAMRALENRTLESKNEMDILAALDEMKSVNSMHAAVRARLRTRPSPILCLFVIPCSPLGWLDLVFCTLKCSLVKTKVIYKGKGSFSLQQLNCVHCKDTTERDMFLIFSVDMICEPVFWYR